MLIENHTRFAQLVYANEDALARMINILIVKATYTFDKDFHFKPSLEQEPLNFSDLCYEDYNTSSLCYPSDLVPFKPQAEVVLIAQAYAPGVEALSRWRCGLVVQGKTHQMNAQVEVCGPRHWQPRWHRPIKGEDSRDGHHADFRGWTLTDPSPVRQIPLRYELAFGGTQQRNDEVIAYERNPLGCGWIDRDLSNHLIAQPAPQILGLNDRLDDPYARLDPANLGPIPPAWLPRRPFGGTYDDAWLQNRWPHWPLDYDFAYHNSAPAIMRWPEFLRGDEAIMLSNLRPESPEVLTKLPGETIVAQLTDAQGNVTRFALQADTLFLDLTGEQPDDCLITLTWRMPLLEADWVKMVVETDTVDAENIVPAPHPADLFKLKPKVSHEQ